MKTTDDLLQFIVNSNFIDPFDKIIPKDKKILISLYKQTTDNSFLTEKQGNLLLGILKFYKGIFTTQISDLIEHPKWSKAFRVLETVKNITLLHDNTKIKIEFSYDRDLKKKIMSVISVIKGNYEIHSPGVITVDLNEKNVVLIVEKLINDNFSFSSELLDIYDKINSLLRNKHEVLDSTINFNNFFKEQLLKDFQDFNSLQEIKILDRRIRYQYNFDVNYDSNELYYLIAKRTSTNIFINSKIYHLIDVINHLEVLERLPILVVLDSRDIEQCLSSISELIEYKSLGNKGVYFRFDNNSDQNKKFNQLIKDHKLNSNLDAGTSIAVISNSTLPKFFIKNKWRPKSVISYTNSFRNNKAHVFSNDVDLKIYYNSSAPIIGDLYEVL